MKVLAFDLGGSSGKLYAAACEHDTIRLEEIHRFPNHGIKLGSGIYWDFPYLFSNLITGLCKACRMYPGEIKSLGLDSFCNDFGLIHENGDLLTPVRCYRDPRTLMYRKALDHKMSPWERHRSSGCQNSPGTTLMHLAAMQEAGQGGLLTMAHKLLHIPDLITYYLTGTIASEYTLASVSQMYDYNARDWNGEILDAYQIPRSLLAPITAPGSRRGKLLPELCDQYSLDPLEVTAVCGHDTASAYLAAPCRENSAIISTGTWCLTGIESGRTIITPETYRYNIANEGGYPGPHHRILKNVTGLWLLQEVRSHYAARGREYTFLELDRMAADAPAFTCLIDPDDEVFFSQGNMPKRIQDKCRSVYGCCPDTPGAVVRCILESLAMKFRWTIDRLELIAGSPIRNIQITGGGCQDRMLARFTANATGRTVRCGPVSATALGNAIVQFISLKAIPDVTAARHMIENSFDITVYEPEDTMVWEQEYQKFLQLYHLPCGRT